MNFHFITFLIVFSVACFIALFIIFNQFKKHNRLLGGVVNYDTFMKRYVFRIDLGRDDFVRQLKIKNAYDVLPYEYDEETGVIVFKKYNTDYKYRIYIQSKESYIILKVEQICFSSKVAYDINYFWINKFNAIPLEFNQFGV